MMSITSDQITIAVISLISVATLLLSWSFISQYGGEVIFESTVIELKLLHTLVETKYVTFYQFYRSFNHGLMKSCPDRAEFCDAHIRITVPHYKKRWKNYISTHASSPVIVRTDGTDTLRQWCQCS